MVESIDVLDTWRFGTKRNVPMTCSRVNVTRPYGQRGAVSISMYTLRNCATGDWSRNTFPWRQFSFYAIHGTSCVPLLAFDRNNSEVECFCCMFACMKATIVVAAIYCVSKPVMASTEPSHHSHRAICRCESDRHCSVCLLLQHILTCKTQYKLSSLKIEWCDDRAFVVAVRFLRHFSISISMFSSKVHFIDEIRATTRSRIDFVFVLECFRLFAKCRPTSNSLSISFFAFQHWEWESPQRVFGTDRTQTIRRHYNVFCVVNDWCARIANKPIRRENSSSNSKETFHWQILHEFTESIYERISMALR